MTDGLNDGMIELEKHQHGKSKVAIFFSYKLKKSVGLSYKLKPVVIKKIPTNTDISVS